MTTFRFNWYKKAREAFLIALVFSLLISLIDWEVPGWSNFFLGILFGALLFFLVMHGLRPLESYHLQKDGLTLRRPWGADRFLPYQQIRRVVVREEKNALGADRLSLTLFPKSGKRKKIMVSDLRRSALFLQKLEEKARQFKIIYQNEQGEIFRTV